MTTITSPNGATIRYKQPGKDGVCETTPGVNSYSGYVSLNATTNMFFWFVCLCRSFSTYADDHPGSSKRATNLRLHR